MTTSGLYATTTNRDHVEWNGILEEIAWGLFLLMLGVLWLLPNEQVPADLWLLGAGVILAGLNLARALLGIPVSIFTTILGFAGITFGVASWLGVDVPVFAVLMILFGLYILVRPLLRPSRA